MSLLGVFSCLAKLESMLSVPGSTSSSRGIERRGILEVTVAEAAVARRHGMTRPGVSVAVRRGDEIAWAERLELLNLYPRVGGLGGQSLQSSGRKLRNMI